MTCVSRGKSAAKRHSLFYLLAVFCVMMLILLSACDDTSNIDTGDLGDVGDGDVKIVFVLLNGEDDVECLLDDPFPIPEYEGYLFDGWCLDAEGETEIDEDGILDSLLDGEDTLRVYAKWLKIISFTGVVMRDALFNYDGAAHLPSVEGLPEGAEVAFVESYEFVDAGEYDVTAIVSKRGYYDLELHSKLTIEKSSADMSGISFFSETFVWDGLEKSLSIEGDLPDGISVSYEENGKTDVGVYTVTARFDAGNNYLPIDDMTATLTIVEKLCTVTFIEEDGSSFTREVGYGRTLDDAPAPVAKRGYSGAWIGASLENVCENITVRADYTLDGYSIEYSLGGGMIGDSAVTEFSVLDGVTLPSASREYYDFDGWFESEDFDGEEVLKIEIGSVGDRTFYAKWTAIEFAVEYVLNGGVNDLSNTTDGVVFKYTVESEPLTLSSPTKRGYDFLRWTDGENEVTEIDTGHPKNLVLRAEWDAVEYGIEYKLDGGVNGAGYVRSYTVEDGEIALPTPVKSGYDFGGWHLTVGGDDDEIGVLDANLAKDITLYARWSAIDYSITYNLNGGTNNIANPDVYTVESGELSLVCANKRGYTFDGWYKDADFSADEITELNALVDGDVTLFAKWSANVYSVTYHLDGGTNSGDNPSEFTVEDGALTLADPSKEGFEFKGWFASEDLDGEPIDSIDCTLCEDVELYAKWEEITEGGDGDDGNGGSGDGNDNNGDEDDNKGDGENQGNNDSDRTGLTVENVEGRNIVTAYDYSLGGDVIIPVKVGDAVIEGIAAGVLKDARSVEIRAELEEIEADVFAQCYNLTSLVLPATLTSMPQGLLADCISLESLTVPFACDRPVTGRYGQCNPLGILFGEEKKPECYGTIIRTSDVVDGEYEVIFDDPPTRYIPYSLKSITVLGGDVIPFAIYGFASVTEIDIRGCGGEVYQSAFRECAALETLKLPTSATTIANTVIIGCSALTKVYVGAGADIDSIMDVLSKRGLTDVEIIIYPN